MSSCLIVSDFLFASRLMFDAKAIVLECEWNFSAPDIWQEDVSRHLHHAHVSLKIQVVMCNEKDLDYLKE